MASLTSRRRRAARSPGAAPRCRGARPGPRSAAAAARRSAQRRVGRHRRGAARRGTRAARAGRRAAGRAEPAHGGRAGGERAQPAGVGEQLEYERAGAARSASGRSKLRSTCARASSISLSYWTPDGQAVTHAMQPRQRSRCSTSGGESSPPRAPRFISTMRPRGESISSPQSDVGRAGRQAEAAVHAVVDQLELRARGSSSKPLTGTPPTRRRCRCPPGRSAPSRAASADSAGSSGPQAVGVAARRARRAPRRATARARARSRVDGLGRAPSTRDPRQARARARPTTRAAGRVGRRAAAAGSRVGSAGHLARRAVAERWPARCAAQISSSSSTTSALEAGLRAAARRAASACAAAAAPPKRASTAPSPPAQRTSSAWCSSGAWASGDRRRAPSAPGRRSSPTAVAVAAGQRVQAHRHLERSAPSVPNEPANSLARS